MIRCRSLALVFDLDFNQNAPKWYSVQVGSHRFANQTMRHMTYSKTAIGVGIL